MRIGVVTGTRAEWGLLRPVVRALRDRHEVQVIATGSHLSPEFGMTVDEVEAESEVVDRIEALLSSDSPTGVATSLGLTTIGFASSLARLGPELLVVLGDRYEILGAVQAALIARIPVVHLSGGDVTEGAIDDAIRHAITKMSHLHLVFTEVAADRVRQMGEDPTRVVVTGNPGLDALVASPAWSADRLASSLGLELRPRNLLVTYHPVTLAHEPPARAFEELLAALDRQGDGVGLIFTHPNADTDGRVLMRMIHEFVSTHRNAVAHPSLGFERYAASLRAVDAVVGNSSSGLIEAPAVGTPTVNVGERQRGRLRGPATIDCPAEREAIAAAIERALSSEVTPSASPYGDGHAVPRVVEAIETVSDDPRQLLYKSFHTLPGGRL